ncbi:MAG: carbohydrate ABC transporter permease [Anaerolineae bacterium]|jgi:multiple sugar transport system permease protein|nr:sugar ABC transporter permease [Chloroflexota bacterium]
MAVSVAPQKRRRMSKLERSDFTWGVIFASPWIIGFLALTGWPILSSIYYSFTQYSVLSASRWVGFSNYRELFMVDDVFRRSLGNSAYFAVFFVPLAIACAITIAILLNQKIHGQTVYRTIYFLPVLVPDVALSILWLWMLNPQVGLVNTIIWKFFHVQGPGWVADPKWSKPAVILMSLWTIGRSVVIYLAALQDVPQDLYDAGAVDGTNWWQRIRHVTLPMISSVIFFTLITSMIGALQMFTVPYIMSQGDGRPAQSLMFYAMALYRNAFVYFKMGYACAMAWVLFIIVMFFTLLTFRSSGRWVYYAGG